MNSIYTFIIQDGDDKWLGDICFYGNYTNILQLRLQQNKNTFVKGHWWIEQHTKNQWQVCGTKQSFRLYGINEQALYQMNSVINRFMKLRAFQ